MVLNYFVLNCSPAVRGVYMCVCVCVCMFVCMCARACTCACMRVNAGFILNTLKYCDTCEKSLLMPSDIMIFQDIRY